MKQKLKPWTLHPEDIGFSQHGSTQGRRTNGKLSRQLSARDERSVELRATHIPTGVMVSQTIPVGHYSNTELQDMKKKAEQRLVLQLEDKVAKALRIPGYTKKATSF